MRKESCPSIVTKPVVVKKTEETVPEDRMSFNFSNSYLNINESSLQHIAYGKSDCKWVVDTYPQTICKFTQNIWTYIIRMKKFP
jgi:hypothetical protein